MIRSHSLLAALSLAVLAMIAMSVQATAQTGDLAGVTPVNLSHSGAASSPVIAASPDGRLRILWWDKFDGLMVADGAAREDPQEGVDWSAPAQAPILLSSSVVISGEEQLISVPLKTMPYITADVNGHVHALWLGEPDKETGERSLMYSRLSSGTAWTPPQAVAGSAAGMYAITDRAGTTHLAYVQTVDTPSYPAGVYYRRAGEDAADWSAPVSLGQSRYFRLLSTETAHVHLAVDDSGGVYVTWDDPHLEQLWLAHSPDGGATWEDSRPLTDPEGQPRRGQLLAVPGRETLLLWQAAGTTAGCSLVQAPAAEVATAGLQAGKPVLQSLTACPEDARFLPLGEGQVLMVAGSGSDSLTLAVWDGEQWSEPKRLGFSFPDPETERQLYLSGLQAALAGLPQDPTGGSKDQALVVAGMDQEGDLWATKTLMGAVEVVFAPPSPWSEPVSFAQSAEVPGLPAIASDATGRKHVLWSESQAGGGPGTALLYARRDEATTASGGAVRWTSPIRVLQSAEGGADQPALIAVGERLHAVWRGGQDGEIFYSQAFASDAYVASGWTEPQVLPAPAALGSWPHIAADMGGTLHVVYALPINEGRGIYYTRSDDGETWSPARQVFDAAAAGWAMSDYPRLAVDLAGTIHVVWVRADPFGSGLTQAIYYAQSVDGGETWSAPIQVAEGAYAWPQVTVSGTGQVHLLWNQTSGENALWHQWSADGGLGWTRPERVPGFGNVGGPVGLLADGSETLYLVGLGRDDRGGPALLRLTWDGQRWGEREMVSLDLATDEPVAGVSAALLPPQGQLDVLFRTEGEVEGTQHAVVWHTGRAVPTVVTTPIPTFTPRPTPTPLPTATPALVPTPTRSFSQAPPPGSSGSTVDLLPVLLPVVVAALILAVAFGVGWLRRGRR